jgi:hypothetical protein
MGWVDDLFDELEVGADARRLIWGGTAAAWLGIDAGEHAGRDAASRRAGRDPGSRPASTTGTVAEVGDESTGRPMRLRDFCC